MKNIKNMLAFVLALVLVVGCIPFAAFASTETAFGFSDFPTGWSNAAMTDAVENGLITGFGDGTVRPRQLLTRAEMAAIMVRAFGAEVSADIAGKYSDVTPDKWYYDVMAKAVNMRLFTGYEDNTMHPENPITRQEAILVIARALVINSEDPHLLDVYTDKNKIGDFAKGALATFTLRGYIHGYEDSTIRPTNNITREEFAQIMYNIFAAYVRTDGSFTIGDHEGEVILTGDNVHLYSSNIDGDLIIGDGVGATNVTLENVIVKGRIIFRGGEGLVTLRNVTKGGLIVTNDFNGTVNFNHYSTERYFKDAVYNTPASFLNRTVAGGTASGEGLGNHDTHVEGRVDAGTGEEEKKPSKPVIVGPGGGGGTTPETKTYDVTVDPANGDPTIKYEDITSGKTFKNMGYELPEDPTKDGYKFNGWYTDANGLKRPFTENTKINKEETVYADWLPGVFFYVDSTFATQFGETVYVEEGNALEEKFPAEVPTKAGFIFKGWKYNDGTGEKDFTAATVVTKPVKAYAAWEEVTTPVTKYTVTFYDDKGGNVFGAPIEVEENKSLGDNFPTEVPTKDGFTFVKWATEGDVEFTKDTAVTGDLTVYPIWEEVTTPVTKYTVTFYDDKGGNVFGTPIEVEENTALGDNFPTEVPTKDGFTFVKWATEGDVEFTKDTAVTGDLTVYPIWEEIEKYTVIFYEYGWMDVHSTEVEPGATVESDEIDTAYNALSTPFEQGYEANQDEESYISDATTARIHEIEGQWYYLVDGAYEVFDDTVVVNSDLEVYYYFDYMYALVSLESIFGQMGNYQFEAPFAEDTLAAESVLDLLWLNRAAFKTILKTATDPVFGKSIKLGDIIEYMPVNEKGEIMNPVYDYRLIKLLGESTVRKYVTDAVADMVESDEVVLRSAINDQLELASIPENVKTRKAVDTFVMSDETVKAAFVEVAKEILKAEHPEYTAGQIDALADDILATPEKRLSLIQLTFADPANREIAEDIIVVVVRKRIVEDQDCEFTEQVVDIAESSYQDEIDTFMDQLKNEDAYLINTEDDGTDRRFIINAVSKKLQATTYEEIKAKLPSVIFKILDEDVAMDIFTTTLGNYIAEVDAVKAAVWAADYDGSDYWVSSYVPVVVNPITQVLIPTYDKAMAKLDPKIQGYKYYTENPFIAELEALVHYNQLIEKVDSPSEGASGYALYMDGDSIDADVYFSLVYKMAVLSYDAVDWTIENVPETELDATLGLMADRLSGFYDKLADKVAQLGSGKPAQIRDKAFDYFNKVIDKDNANIWNTVTPTLFDEKLDKIYAKGTKLVLEKSGFDVTQTITVEIAEDCKTVTLTQGTKVVSKSIADIAKDITAAGFTVSVNGSVINVDGKFEIDVAEYAKKVANKLGYVFNFSFYEDTAEIDAVPEVLRAYVLNVNSDYVKLQIRLK